MSRYIDADVLKEKMLKYGFHSVDQTITEFVEDILPTADVFDRDECLKCAFRPFKQLREQLETNMVEVVRCKDCINWQTDWNTSHDGYHYCSMVDIVTDGDFYCKDGERKILPKD